MSFFRRTYFILEELTKRLNELQLHVLLETTDIVVRLDGGGGSLEGGGLDDIGVQGALGMTVTEWHMPEGGNRPCRTWP